MYPLDRHITWFIVPACTGISPQLSTSYLLPVCSPQPSAQFHPVPVPSASRGAVGPLPTLPSTANQSNASL